MLPSWLAVSGCCELQPRPTARGAGTVLVPYQLTLTGMFRVHDMVIVFYGPGSGMREASWSGFVYVYVAESTLMSR